VDIKTFSIIKKISFLNVASLDTTVYSSGVAAALYGAGRVPGQIKKNEKKNEIYNNTVKKKVYSLPINKSGKSPISSNFGKIAPEKNSTFLYNDVNKTQYTTSSNNMNINSNMNNNILAGSHNINSALENTQR
jgi:hypothetical protein